MKTNIIKFGLVTFIWSWGMWLAGWFLAVQQRGVLATDMTLFDLLNISGDTQYNFVAQVLFALAVFGPLVGYLVMRAYRPLIGAPSRLTVALTIGVPLVSLLPALVLSMLTLPPNTELTAATALMTVLAYFVSNLLTSGTEEFGWRGYLYPALKQSEPDFWKVSLRGGIIWAVWHLPLMLILYASLGVAMIGVLAGFVASIIAMNYITNVVYELSNSILLVIVLHALNNTATFTLMLLFPQSPYTLITAVMAWGIVGILEKKVIKPVTY